MYVTDILQVKIHRADIPQDISAKAVEKLNEAMDKYQIEKVRVCPDCFDHIYLITGYGYLR